MLDFSHYTLRVPRCFLRSKVTVVLFSIPFLLLMSCSGDFGPKDGDATPVSREDARKYGDGKLLGDDFLLFGGSKKYDPHYGGAMPVNPYLWRASLEVISFMPLVSSDAAGGVLVTDWYSSGDKPNERVKLTIRITDRVFRADALHVGVNKQVRSRQGQWVDVIADRHLAREMEDLILTKARELKIKG